MKIVVNTRVFRKNKMDGIGWFAYNTLRRITTENPKIEFHFLFDSGIDESFLFSDNITPHNLFPPAKHAVLNIAWFEWSVKKVLQKVKPDLFFSPDGILCLGYNGKQFGVIHDINFYHHPNDLKFSNRVYYNYFFPRFAKRAFRLATVSEYSRSDIATSFGIPPGKIDVVYAGINSFYHVVDEKAREQTRSKYSNGHPFFVFIGTISPRKNLLNLMKAFSAYKKDSLKQTKLLIVGGEMYRARELHEFKKSMTYGEDVIFTGRLPDAALNTVLASSLALVFVPKFEGFGIPLVEAMQCEVPIIASNVTSIPEVVRDAALLVDPFDVKQIATAMDKIDSDGVLRSSLIDKGRIRRQFFSWEKTADLLWTSIEKTL